MRLRRTVFECVPLTSDTMWYKREMCPLHELHHCRRDRSFSSRIFFSFLFLIMHIDYMWNCAVQQLILYCMRRWADSFPQSVMMTCVVSGRSVTLNQYGNVAFYSGALNHSCTSTTVTFRELYNTCNSFKQYIFISTTHLIRLTFTLLLLPCVRAG